MIRVPINREVDADLLRRRIVDTISTIKNKQQAYIDKVASDKRSLHDICFHYLRNKSIAKNVEQMCIEQSKIHFTLYTRFSISINPDGTLISASMYGTEMKTTEVVDEFVNNVAANAKAFKSTLTAILGLVPVKPELQEWTKGKYHQYFYTETMSAERPKTGGGLRDYPLSTTI